MIISSSSTTFQTLTCMRSPGILLKCRLWVSSAEVGPKSVNSASPLVLVVNRLCFEYQSLKVLDRREKGNFQVWSTTYWSAMKGKNIDESMKILCIIQSPYLGLLVPTSAPESNLNRWVTLFFVCIFLKARWGWERNGVGISLPNNVGCIRGMTFMEEEIFELSPLGE